MSFSGHSIWSSGKAVHATHNKNMCMCIFLMKQKNLWAKICVSILKTLLAVWNLPPEVGEGGRGGRCFRNSLLREVTLSPERSEVTSSCCYKDLPKAVQP